MKKIFEKILTRKEFQQRPPVLIDIGASGDLPHEWKLLAKYSIGITFDADSREVEYLKKENDHYKKFYVFPFALVEKEKSDVNFYLTKSPYCSSTLEPDKENLADWDFAELFKVVGTKKVKAITLEEVFKQIKINYVDWFKTDSQGTDLRLFLSLPKKMINRVLATQFEPGILDGYKSEDKLWQVLAEMDKRPFWMAEMELRGTKKISQKTLKKLNHRNRERISLATPISPGWGEMLYLNRMSDKKMTSRDYLLMWVIAMIKKQYGYAMEIAFLGKKNFRDLVWNEMEIATIEKCERTYPAQLAKNKWNYYWGIFKSLTK